MILAVDFDGTLVKDNWPEIGEPIPVIIAYVKALRRKGWKLILWTCRSGDELEKAVSYCRDKFKIVFDAVNENLPESIEKHKSDSRKISADRYLDDRSYGYDKLWEMTL